MTTTNKNISAHPAFLTVWFGQSISTLGAQMTGFVLSIWIYNQSNSLIAFGIVVAAQLGPALIFSPFAGVLIDRHPRKTIMLLCDFGMFLVCLGLTYLAYENLLTINSVLFLTPVLSLMAMFHNIAYSSSISHLVPKELYGKANAMVQIAVNLSAVLVPIASILILEFIGLKNVLILNAISYLVAIVTLLVIKFPFAVEKKPEKSNFYQILKEQKFGFSYLLDNNNQTLFNLLILLCIVMMLNGAVQVLFRPMILDMHSDRVVGWLVSIAGAGGLVGAIFSGVFVRQTNRLESLLKFAYLASTASIVCGFTQNIYVMAVVVFVFSFSIPIVMVASRTFWLFMVPKEIQGKVFAVRTFAISLTMLITVILVPVISEKVMDPLLGSLNSHQFQSYVSNGIGLMFIVIGTFSVLAISFMSYGSKYERLNNDIELLEQG